MGQTKLENKIENSSLRYPSNPMLFIDQHAKLLHTAIYV